MERMSQYNELHTPDDSAIVFIDHQPQMSCELFALRAR